jgi:hypothetical protein
MGLRSETYPSEIWEMGTTTVGLALVVGVTVAVLAWGCPSERTVTGTTTAVDVETGPGAVVTAIVEALELAEEAGEATAVLVETTVAVDVEVEEAATAVAVVDAVGAAMTAV